MRFEQKLQPIYWLLEKEFFNNTLLSFQRQRHLLRNRFQCNLRGHILYYRGEKQTERGPGGTPTPQFLRRISVKAFSQTYAWISKSMNSNCFRDQDVILDRRQGKRLRTEHGNTVSTQDRKANTSTSLKTAK